MPNAEVDIKGLIKLLSVWVVEIRMNNGIYWYDANRVSESLAVKLLNLIYDLELRDLNDDHPNFPGLDLGDTTKTYTAFQITSRTDTDKVISDLRMVVKKKYHETFTGGIKFLILSDGSRIEFKKIKPKDILPSFDPEKDIIYLEELARDIKKIYEIDEIRFLQIKNLLEKQIKIKQDEQPPILDEFKHLLTGFTKQVEEFKRQNHIQAHGSIEFAKDLHLPAISIISARTNLVTDCLNRLDVNPVLWMYGSISTGKTQLALLIGKRFDPNAYWIDLRDYDNDNFLENIVVQLSSFLGILKSKTLLETAKVIFAFIGGKSLLILNDVPDLAGKETEKRNFVSFLQQTRDYDIRVIITSSFQPFDLAKEALGDKLNDFKIPPFDKDETYEVLRFHGADDKLALDNAGLITTLTEGHPLIINSACKYLKEHNWDFTSEVFLAIFRNDYGENYKSELYARIIDSTHDDQTKSLLYRLQVIAGTFTEKEIRAVANAVPEIGFAEERSQKLKGVWLQEVESGNFQLSPLIKNLSYDLTESVKLEINKGLGDLILSKKLLSQIEASRAINYYYKGKDFSKLSFVLALVLQESLKIPELFFDWGFSFYWYYTSLPKEIPPFFKVYIRFLQINISIQHNEETDFLVSDLEQIIQNEDAGVLGNGLAHLMLCYFYSKKEPVKALEHFILARRDMNEVGREVPELAFTDISINDSIWISFYGLRTSQEYVDWFNKFREIPDEFVSRNIENSQGYIVASHSLTHLTVIEAGADPAVAIESLTVIIDAALAVQLPLIAIYALRYQIRIAAVYLNDFSKVIQSIEKYNPVIQEHSIYKYLINDEYGRQLFYAGENDESFRILTQIADITLPECYIDGIDSSIVYAQLIGKQDEKIAHYFIEKALRRAQSDKFYAPIDLIKLYGEVGISYWLNADNIQAIYHLAAGYELLLKGFDNSHEQQAAVIRYGHVINYIRGIITDGKPPEKTADGEPYSPPFRGSFYGSMDKLLVERHYYDERKFMVATILEDCFEYLNDYKIARQWALTGIEISLGLKSPEYIPILYKSLSYLIADRNYVKATNLFIYIEKYLKELRENKEGEKAKLLAEVVEKNKLVTTDEAIFYQYLVIPIVITVVDDLIKERIKKQNYSSFISDLFEALGQKIEDAGTFRFVRQLFDNVLLHDLPSEKFYELVNTYKGEYISQVQTIGYLLYSVNADASECVRLHLPLMPEIEQFFKPLFKGFYKFTIISFFEDFWLKKFELYKEQFSEKSFWYSKSLPRFKESTWDKKLKTLFQALVHHLNISTSIKLDNWLYSD